MTKGGVKVIKQKILVDADPQFVFDSYVDPVRHAEFTGSPATGKARVGGTFTAWDEYITGKYIELVKGKKIVHEWTTTEWPSRYPPSVVEITLEKVGDKTKLTFVQSKVPAEQAEEYRQGWIDNYWVPLKEYVKKDRS